ncbi:MAG: phasin family protein [candidate division FCPU426 bacterium]
MQDVIKKAFLAGVGALSLTKERAQRVVKELVEQGQIREQEGKKVLADMLQKVEAARKDVQKTVGTQVSATYQKMNLATQAQLNKMERRIKELERQLNKQAAPKKKAKR